MNEHFEFFLLSFSIFHPGFSEQYPDWMKLILILSPAAFFYPNVKIRDYSRVWNQQKEAGNAWKKNAYRFQILQPLCFSLDKTNQMWF